MRSPGMVKHAGVFIWQMADTGCWFPDTGWMSGEVLDVSVRCCLPCETVSMHKTAADMLERMRV